MRSLLVRRNLLTSGHALTTIALGVMGSLAVAGCATSTAASADQGQADGGPGQALQPEQGDAGTPENVVMSEDASTNPDSSQPNLVGQTGADGGADATGGGADAAGEAGAKGGFPSGWLYTQGAKIMVSNGNGGTPWMGRGVNMDDIFFCGYNGGLSMSSPAQTLETVATGLISGWKPNFVRISLSMDTDSTVVSWVNNPAQYATPMTNVINAIGANPNTYVLVTLRSDPSMILYDQSGADKEATGVPSDSTTTPDPVKYPTGTDATYVGLVDSFANSKFVMFGLTNEPGGTANSDEVLAARLNHAVGTIRAEEDRLGVPHHIVSVQGNGWASDISFYAKTPAPITYDNVVYEIHGYPPPPVNYTYPTIPVIIGEYGSLTNSTSAAFYADLEAKQISNLAWDFEPYSPCAPDLLNVDYNDPTSLVASSWGSIVQSYLLSHTTP